MEKSNMEKHSAEKNDRTELVFILDRSGSMAGLESDTIGGYNAMMDMQRGGEVTVTTVLFDDQYELLHDRIALEKLRPMSAKEYYVRGSTALIDAIGKTILKIENSQAHTADAHKADKVIFVITTDGLENASREFRAEDVKKMVEGKREKDGWEFIFLGANIDAVETAKSYGFAESRAVRFCSDSDGIALNSRVLGETLNFMRCEEALISDEEMECRLSEITADYEKRGRKDE
jgi:uncharacterized protein YegL